MNPRARASIDRRFESLRAQYLPKKELGRGAFSQVWDAVKVGRGAEPVAIKMLHLDAGGGEDAASAAEVSAEGGGGPPKKKRRRALGVDITLLWELQVYANLEHENLIRPKHVAFRTDPGFSVLLYLDRLGMDLARFNHAVHKTRVLTLAPAQLDSVLYQYLLGVAVLHANGVVHRDLKPANVLVDPGSGVLKIIDFGWSRHFTVADTVMISTGSPGTPFYRAPEAITYSPEHGPPFDVWSSGCVVYEVLTGHRVFLCALKHEDLQLGMRCPLAGCGPLIEAMMRVLGVPDPSYPPAAHPFAEDFHTLARGVPDPIAFDAGALPHRLEQASRAPHLRRYWAAVGGMFHWEPGQRATAAGVIDALYGQEPVPRVPLGGSRGSTSRATPQGRPR